MLDSIMYIQSAYDYIFLHFNLWTWNGASHWFNEYQDECKSSKVI